MRISLEPISRTNRSGTVLFKRYPSRGWYGYQGTGYLPVPTLTKDISVLVKDMSRTVPEKRLVKFHKIYEQLYEDPFCYHHEIAKKTGISRSTVSRNIKAMRSYSILKGPVLSLKPTQNYRLYGNFLKFNNPLTAYRGFGGFPFVVERSLGCGCWNVSLVCDRLLDFSGVKGFNHSLFSGVKGVTLFSKVKTVDWQESLKKMHDALVQPKVKSSLYEEVPPIPWNEKEWMLYKRFRPNIRMRALHVIKELRMRFEQYQEWLSKLKEVALIQPAFYPHGIDNYLTFDFLFESLYHTQLIDILGWLPSTCLFHSVGDYLFARLFVLNKRERNDLLSFLYIVQEEGFFCDFFSADIIEMSQCGGFNG